VCMIGSKSACEKERLTEKQIDRGIEMLARGTSASFCVRVNSRVVQRGELCV
jgi:hypothetical protein